MWKGKYRGFMMGEEVGGERGGRRGEEGRVFWREVRSRRRLRDGRGMAGGGRLESLRAVINRTA